MRFLDFYFQEYQRGLPEQAQLADIASFVTPELLSLFEAAAKGEGCYLARINDEGPSPVQGDLFASLFEGATSATYRQIVEEMNAATFEIEWTHDSEVSEGPFIWQDRVALVRMAENWLIDDFIYLGTWDFSTTGAVSQVLRAISQECVNPIL